MKYVKFFILLLIFPLLTGCPGGLRSIGAFSAGVVTGVVVSNGNYYNGYYIPQGRKVPPFVQCRHGLPDHPEYIYRNGYQQNTCAYFKHWRAGNQSQPRYSRIIRNVRPVQSQPCNRITSYGNDVNCQYRTNIIHPQYINDCGEQILYCDYYCR